MTVTFSAPIYVISNLTSLDERVFQVGVRPGRESRAEDVALKGWTVISKRCLINTFLSRDDIDGHGNTGQVPLPRENLSAKCEG
jgi:hypothetical protein